MKSFDINNYINYEKIYGKLSSHQDIKSTDYVKYEDILKDVIKGNIKFDRGSDSDILKLNRDININSLIDSRIRVYPYESIHKSLINRLEVSIKFNFQDDNILYRRSMELLFYGSKSYRLIYHDCE